MVWSGLVLLLLFALSLAAPGKSTSTKAKPHKTSTSDSTAKYLAIYGGLDIYSSWFPTKESPKSAIKNNLLWIELSKMDAESLLLKDPSTKVYPNVFPFKPHACSAPKYNDPMYTTSWYFGSDQGFPAMGIEGLWELGVTGKGVTVMVIDDSVSFYHPELNNKKNGPYSYNYKDESKSTDPTSPGQMHGTSVAGIIASTAGNSQCGVGIATGSDIAARIALYEGTKPSIIIRAMTEDVTDIGVINNSWSVDTCDGGKAANGRCYLLPGSGIEQAAKTAATYGRRGLGTIVVFAVGDQGINKNADTNLSPLTRSPHVVTVGAILRSGTIAPYSVTGKSLFLVGPSGADNGDNGLVAPRTRFEEGSGQLVHDCVTNFTGTSAAAAVVSGVISMVVQNNPRLTLQDIRQVLIRSATRVQPQDPSWVTNAAGISHSRIYGFGYINASAAVALSSLWPETTSYTTQQASIPDTWNHKEEATSYTRFMDNGNIVIPPNSTVIVPFFFKRSDSLIIENIVVTIPNVAGRSITVAAGKASSVTATLFSEIVKVTEEGVASSNPDLDLVTNGDGTVDNSVNLLTYEYTGLISSGTWEVSITNNEKQNLSIKLSGMKLTAYGLPSIMEIPNVETIYSGELLETIRLKPTVNSVGSVTYKYGRGMYAYIKVGEKDPMIVVDDDGKAVSYDPMSTYIEIKWRSVYGCQALKGCTPYNEKIMIILVNAEGTFEALSFTTSQNISSAWIDVTVTVAPGDEGLVEAEEEVVEEEIVPIPPAEEEDGKEEKEEEEEGCSEEILPPIPPQEEEEESIIPSPEEECEEGVIVEEESECEELVPWPDEEEEQVVSEEEESVIPPPIYPPEEEDIVDGFDLDSAKITKLVTALTALLVALAL